MTDRFLFEREGDVLQPRDFYSALAEVEGLGHEVKQIHMHPVTARDLYTWDMNVTGWSWAPARESSPIARYGGFELIRDLSIPPGHFKLVPREDVDEQI